MTTPICPRCGEKATKSETIYGPKHECCGLWSWGNKSLADRATHEARKAAHKAFDALWKGKIVTRGHAYALLQKELGLKPVDCHMAMMSAETAKRVPEAVEHIRKALEAL